MSKLMCAGKLTLSNRRPNDKARIAMVSLPVAADGEAPMSLGRMATQVQPVAWWPQSVAGCPGKVRRQLMFGLSDGPIPDEVPVAGQSTASGAYAGPLVACHIVRKINTGITLYEVNQADITYGGKTIGLRMGLRHAGEYKWWEWVRVEELWSGPVCKAVRMAGFIEVEHFDDAYLATLDGEIHSKALHLHNWLRGEVFAILFSNGVVHLTCRHINNHLFDHGRDLEDVVPVIGLSCPTAGRVDTKLDGTRVQFDLGGTELNLSEAASLVCPEHPGLLRSEGDQIVYQPYEGVEIFGDSHHRARTDGYIVKAGETMVPKGVARTVRFALAFGDAPVEITRLVAPDWWYGASGELWPDRSLPARDDFDSVLEHMEGGVLKAEASRPRCFDNGVLTRSAWEGEVPYSQMLYYYLSGDLRFFDVALNDAYQVADIGFDHATETMRMHDYPFGAIAPPLCRTVGMTFGYLETGDPYLLECSESAATHWYWIDRHNWPRRSYGRDAASIRSLIFLWDYTGEDLYLHMAREAIGRAIQCQRPDGSYADQGGTVGGCGGACNEVIKVWMAMLANDAFVDYLLRCPDDTVVLEAVRRTGEFVLKAQIEKDGKYYWAYQYAYGDNPGDPREMRVKPTDFQRHPIGCRLPAEEARFLTYLTERTGDARYIEAWQRFHDTHGKAGARWPDSAGYTSNKVVQHIPYLQSHKWAARLGDGVVRIRPLLTDRWPDIEGTVSTPYGPLKLRCVRDKKAITVETRCEQEFEVLVELPHAGAPLRMKSNEVRTTPISRA